MKEETVKYKERIIELESAINLMGQAMDEVKTEIIVQPSRWHIVLLCCVWFILGAVLFK